MVQLQTIAPITVDTVDSAGVIKSVSATGDVNIIRLILL